MCVLCAAVFFSPEVYPSNQQFIKHFPEFVRYGYRPHLGAIEVKFPWKDGSRSIGQHTVGIVDGFCKILCMMATISFCKELELTETDLNHPTLSATLASFASVSCSYNHFEHPGHHYLYSLRPLDWVLNISAWYLISVFFALSHSLRS